MTTQHHIPFNFEIPMSVFEKADAEPGKRRRIGGIASLETKDRQDETILQRGLDFSDFVDNGWFNDNHSKKTAGVVGHPESTHFFTKGTVLPDKTTAGADGHWVEGYLLEGYKPADEIWDLARSLAKTDRRLGFSVEGKILKRFKKSDTDKFIASAKVREVAITKCPVLTGSRMEILAKSLQTVENSDDTEDMDALCKRVDAIEKALTMGEGSPDTPVGPRTGEGAAAILAKESLEGKGKPVRVLKDEDKDKKKKKLTKAEAIAWVLNRVPNATTAWAERFVSTALVLKRQGT